MRSGYVLFMIHDSLGGNKNFSKGPSRKVTSNQVHQIWSWYVVFIKPYIPIGDNQKYLKRTFKESHLKSGPLDMVLVCRVCQTEPNRRQLLKDI